MRSKKTLFILIISICMAFLYTLSVVDIHSLTLSSEKRVKVAFSNLLVKPGIRLSINQPIDSFAGVFTQSNVPNVGNINDMGVAGTITIFPKERVFDYEVKISNDKEGALLDFSGFSDETRVYFCEERVLRQKFYVLKKDLLEMEELDRTSLFNSFNTMLKTTKKVGYGKYIMTAMFEDKPIGIELTITADTQIGVIKILLDDNEAIVIKVETTSDKLKAFDVGGAKVFNLENWTLKEVR